jgi:ribosomal protein S18 acetylase RimI-like enzyme
MRLRPASEADLPALTRMQQAFDIAWFGSPENDEPELREWLDLGDRTCVVERDGIIVGSGSIWRTGSSLIADPTEDAAEILALLVPWLGEWGAPETDVLDRDQALRTALESVGWRHLRSAFELLRPITDDWTRPDAVWPDGVQVRPYVASDDDRLHNLIYCDARWADVPGHVRRDLDEWRRLFISGRSPADAPVLAYRGAQLIGAAIGRTFSDGMGYVSQLAVAMPERGKGLGRALLLEAFDRRAAAGANALGLSVMVTNRDALRLYESLGLRVDREWMTYAPRQS